MAPSQIACVRGLRTLRHSPYSTNSKRERSLACALGVRTDRVVFNDELSLWAAGTFSRVSGCSGRKHTCDRSKPCNSSWRRCNLTSAAAGSLQRGKRTVSDESGSVLLLHRHLQSHSVA